MDVFVEGGFSDPCCFSPRCLFQNGVRMLSNLASLHDYQQSEIANAFGLSATKRRTLQKQFLDALVLWGKNLAPGVGGP